MPEKFLGVLDTEDGGIKQEIWYEEHTDKLITRDVQNISEILDDNRRELNAEHGRPFGEWKKVACIPNIVVNQLIKDGIWHDRKAFRKWLNDSEFSKFRTKECRL